MRLFRSQKEKQRQMKNKKRIYKINRDDQDEKDYIVGFYVDFFLILFKNMCAVLVN